MRDKFARLFDAGEQQVLLEKDFDEETHQDTLHITTMIQGTRASAILGFETEEDRNEAFDLFGDEDAEEFVVQFINALSDNDEEE